MLQAYFIDLFHPYMQGENNAIRLWNELVHCYNDSSRHYHTMHHLENMHGELQEVKTKIKNYDTTLMALFYHDIIYDAKKSDNESQSALYFEQVMSTTNYQFVEEVKDMILATAGHQETADKDTNLFLDIDLSILGSTEKEYRNYCHQIRKEYSLYPDRQYYEGRKKVLEHFLQMKNIFKTTYFQEKFEKIARRNIQSEIDSFS